VENLKLTAAPRRSFENIFHTLPLSSNPSKHERHFIERQHITFDLLHFRHQREAGYHDRIAPVRPFIMPIPRRRERWHRNCISFISRKSKNVAESSPATNSALTLGRPISPGRRSLGMPDRHGALTAPWRKTLEDTGPFLQYLSKPYRRSANVRCIAVM
jgi:hypothetical protein